MIMFNQNNYINGIKKLKVLKKKAKPQPSVKYPGCIQNARKGPALLHNTSK